MRKRKFLILIGFFVLFLNSCSLLKVNVTFDGNGGTLISGEEVQTVKKGESITAPVYEKEGYMFDGFDIDINNITKSTKIKALWEPYFKYELIRQTNTYSIYFTDLGQTLTEVTLPTTYNNKPITHTRDFSNNPHLQKIVIPEGYLEISDYSLQDNHNLSEVILPNSLKKIKQGAFHSCIALVNIELPESIDFIGAGAFSTCHSLKSIVLPNNLTAIWANTFSNCFNLESVILGNNLESIENNAFASCFKLEEIIIPEGVTLINYEAFSHCQSLKKVVLPNSLQFINYSAFLSCIALDDITFGEGLIYIREKAFSGCYNLKEITLPMSLKGINEEAFAYGSIKEIVIPKNVTHIGSGAFKNSRLEKITFECESLYELYESVFAYCGFLHTVILHEYLAIIRDNAFLNCSRLKEITIPENVSSIGKNAFKGSGLINIYFERYYPCILGTDALATKSDTLNIHIPEGRYDEYVNYSPLNVNI